jgi:tRNA (adenine37-N6)-methyltransferase
MTEQAEEFVVRPVAHVIGGREKPTDDYWGGTRAIIRVDDPRFGEEAVKGLEEFNHLEVVFLFHLVDPDDVHFEARSSRNNPAWPKTGPFVHRNMRKVNRLGVSRCNLLSVDGLDLYVENLDAIDGTPVLDIKPWFAEMGPRGDLKQPSWVSEMLVDYYAPKQE